MHHYNDAIGICTVHVYCFLLKKNLNRLYIEHHQKPQDIYLLHFFHPILGMNEV